MCLQDREHPSNLARKTNSSQDVASQYNKEAFYWYRETTKLLGELLLGLGETVKACNKFRSLDGDHRYFDDVGTTEVIRTRVLRSLRAINETFEKLEAVQGRLLSSKEKCQAMAEHVSLS